MVRTRTTFLSTQSLLDVVVLAVGTSLAESALVVLARDGCWLRLLRMEEVALTSSGALTWPSIKAGLTFKEETAVGDGGEVVGMEMVARVGRGAFAQSFE